MSARTDPAVIGKILSRMDLAKDGVYSYGFVNTDQADEIILRDSVASHDDQDYLRAVSHHHSVPVMDREVDRFLAGIPGNGIIVDVGGCWGWHWRRIGVTRPDVSVFVVDLVRSNLVYATRVLGDQINRNIFLVHGDATSLVFDDNTFDGWWSVQALQHIPNFRKAVSEARRVLKPGGVFANYSLNDQAMVKLIYRLTGRHYHVKGYVPGSFYLARASREQIREIEEIFKQPCRTRYSEILFKPELWVRYPGRERSVLGWIDSLLSSGTRVFSWVARQRSFHTSKSKP